MNKKYFINAVVFIIIVLTIILFFYINITRYTLVSFKINDLTGNNHFTFVIPNGDYVILIKNNKSYNNDKFEKTAINISQIHKIEHYYQFDNNNNWYMFTNSNGNELISIDVRIESNYSFELFAVK